MPGQKDTGLTLGAIEVMVIEVLKAKKQEYIQEAAPRLYVCKLASWRHKMKKAKRGKLLLEQSPKRKSKITIWF